MTIHCAACQSDHLQLTGKTHYWIDADGGWHYHEIECLDCQARMVIDEKGFPHLLAEKPASFDNTHTLMNRGAYA